MLVGFGLQLKKMKLLNAPKEFWMSYGNCHEHPIYIERMYKPVGEIQVYKYKNYTVWKRPDGQCHCFLEGSLGFFRTKSLRRALYAIRIASRFIREIQMSGIW